MSEKTCACIFNVLLGHLVRPNWDIWQSSLQKRVERIQDFLKYIDEVELTSRDDRSNDLLTRGRQVVSHAYLEECTDIISSFRERYQKDIIRPTSIFDEIKRSVKILSLDISPFYDITWPCAWGDPLSNLLSMPMSITGKMGSLDYYLGSGDLTGSSALQCFESIVLAIIETAIHASRTDAIRYLEIKLSPMGFIDKTAQMAKRVLSLTLLGSSFVTDRAVKLMLEQKTLFWLKDSATRDWPYILTNIIIAGNRLRKEALPNIVNLAIESRERYSSQFDTVLQDKWYKPVNR